MELLQNRRYKPDRIPSTYLHEIKTYIEIVIELCREGKISVYEADNVILEELLCCLDYESELEEKLYNANEADEQKMRADADYINEMIDKGFINTGSETSVNESTGETSSSDKDYPIEGIFGSENIFRKWEISDLEKALKDMEEYNDLLNEAQEELRGMFESKDYQKKRKAEIKQQIIKEGLLLSQEKPDNNHTQTNKTDIADRFINNLITLYPEFENDLWLLFKSEYLERTERGLHWKKSKQALAEYFESIKPPEMKNMNWPPIQNAFGEKGLRHSLSQNGNIFKDKSIDFKEWLKIKNNSKLVNKFTSL